MVMALYINMWTERSAERHDVLRENICCSAGFFSAYGNKNRNRGGPIAVGACFSR